MKLTRFLLLCAALAAGQFSPSAGAQNAAEPPSLSDKASDELAKLRPLFEQKNYNALITGIERILPTLANPSYDRAVFNQALAQSYLMAGNERAAMKPIEDALAQGFLDAKTTQDFRFFLAQLNYQFDNKPKALQVLEQWSQAAAAPTRDQQLFFAALLYEAQRYEEALKQVVASLARVERPTEQQLMLKYAALLELKRPEQAAEILELLVQLKPGAATTWQQLVQSYMAAGDNIRAIVTIERGMKAGHFATSRDYFTLVGLYYNSEQFPQVVDLIEQGIESGKLPPDQSNWELLAGSWMQIGDFAKAAEVYGRAAKVVPGGDMDFSRSQLLYNNGQLDEALAATRLAWDKGEFKRASKDRVIRQLAGLAVEARSREQLEFAIERMRSMNLEKEARDFEPWLSDLAGKRS